MGVFFVGRQLKIIDTYDMMLPIHNLRVIKYQTGYIIIIPIISVFENINLFEIAEIFTL